TGVPDAQRRGRALDDPPGVSRALECAHVLADRLRRDLPDRQAEALLADAVRAQVLVPEVRLQGRAAEVVGAEREPLVVVVDARRPALLRDRHEAVDGLVGTTDAAPRRGDRLRAHRGGRADRGGIRRVPYEVADLDRTS